MDDYGVSQALSSLLLSGREKNYNLGAMRLVFGCLLIAVGSRTLLQDNELT